MRPRRSSPHPIRQVSSIKQRDATWTAGRRNAADFWSSSSCHVMQSCAASRQHLQRAYREARAGRRLQHTHSKQWTLPPLFSRIRALPTMRTFRTTRPRRPPASRRFWRPHPAHAQQSPSRPQPIRRRAPSTCFSRRSRWSHLPSRRSHRRLRRPPCPRGVATHLLLLLRLRATTPPALLDLLSLRRR